MKKYQFPRQMGFDRFSIYTRMTSVVPGFCQLELLLSSLIRLSPTFPCGQPTLYKHPTDAKKGKGKKVKKPKVYDTS